MKERPILFNAEMVRAILNGRKTQMRRIIKLPKAIGEEYSSACWDTANRPKYIKESEFAFIDMAHPTESYPWIVKCPYGKAGDKLWVRESAKLITIDGNYLKTGIGHCQFQYEVDGAKVSIWTPDRIKPIKLNYRVPNGCFKELARIWLEITNIRVERVQEITEEDTKAEGVIIRNIGETYWRAFRELWDPINAKRGFGWDKNPYVWVIEFKRVSES